MLNKPDRNQPTPLSQQGGRDTVASIARDQINQIYSTADTDLAADASAASASPYEKTHDANKSAAGWQQYHSAWQNYYQQYYQRYYMAQLHTQSQARQAEKATKEAREKFIQPVPAEGVFSDSPSELSTATIRSELVEKVATRARKLRRSNHFWPTVCALAVGALFLAIQYNQIIIGHVLAYVSPGSADPQNIILDPTVNLKVGPEPLLIIPKINVNVPVDYTLNTTDNDATEASLLHGVAHYPIPGADALPGQVGNNVILGHSSNDVFEVNNYKFVFLLLDKLTKGDTIYLNYQGLRYTYVVTGSEVINPDQVSKLVLTTDKPMISLVTCTPLGTNLRRLVVYGEQVSPDPAKATAAPGNTNTKPTIIPGNKSTPLEQLFGG